MIFFLFHIFWWLKIDRQISWHWFCTKSCVFATSFGTSVSLLTMFAFRTEALFKRAVEFLLSHVSTVSTVSATAFYFLVLSLLSLIRHTSFIAIHRKRRCMFVPLYSYTSHISLIYIYFHNLIFILKYLIIFLLLIHCNRSDE